MVTSQETREKKNPRRRRRYFFRFVLPAVVVGLGLLIALAPSLIPESALKGQIERRLAMGKLVLRIIVQEGGDNLARLLHESGHGITVVDAHGSTGAVKLIYTIIERRDLKEVEDLILKDNPRAFLSVEEISETRAGYFPNRPTPLRDALFGRKNK